MFLGRRFQDVAAGSFKMATKRPTKNMPRYSLYSTDSEDQLMSAQREFDRCATLLKTIADSGIIRESKTKKGTNRLTKSSSKGTHGRPVSSKRGTEVRRALQCPDATSTPIIKVQGKKAQKGSDGISCKTSGINQKTNRRRMTAHRRMKSEPAVNLGLTEPPQEEHSNPGLNHKRSNSFGPTTHEDNSSHSNNAKSFGNGETNPANYQSRQIPLKQAQSNVDTNPLKSVAVSAPHALLNHIPTSHYLQDGRPYPPTYPVWSYPQPIYPFPHHDAVLPPHPHPNPLDPFRMYNPELTRLTSSRWPGIPPSAASEEYPHHHPAHSELSSKMGSSQTHSEDFANTAAELADRLGCILQSLSDVPHNGGKQIHLALEVHKALCHCLSRSDWYEAGSPDSTAEYLAKLQTLQTGNIALQEKLTQSDLKVKKMESDNSRLSKECTSLQKQVKALSDDLARLKLMEKKDHEVGTTMHRLRTELEMSQSEIRMSRMALAEKEGQLSRAYDESFALRHCIAGFLTEATRSRQGNVAQVGWKVPLSLIQKFQELADCGNTQGFLDSLEEPTDQVSDSSLMTTTVDSDISLRDAQHLEGVLLSDKRSTTTLSDLIDTELKDVASSSKKVAKLPYVHQLQAPPRDDLSFQSEATTQTTSSERQFRTELAALDAEIAKLQLQFQTAAAAAN